MNLASKGIATKHHIHELTCLTNQEKGYSSGGWRCDVCSANFNATRDSLNCKQCGFDLCDDCLYSEVDEYFKRKV